MIFSWLRIFGQYEELLNTWIQFVSVPRNESFSEFSYFSLFDSWPTRRSPLLAPIRYKKNIQSLIDIASFCELPVVEIYLSHLPSIEKIVLATLLSDKCRYTSYEIIVLMTDHLYDCDEFASQQIVSFLAKHQPFFPFVDYLMSFRYWILSSDSSSPIGGVKQLYRLSGACCLRSRFLSRVPNS